MNSTYRPPRILILDSEPLVLKTLDHHLRSCNFDPVTTSRWTEAMEVITHDPPDIMLLDPHMPTVQGTAVLEFIQGQELTFPVIVVSAHLERENLEILRRLGAVEFIPKPFQSNEIVDTIRKTLKDRATLLKPLVRENSPDHHADVKDSEPNGSSPLPDVEQGYTALEQDISEIIETLPEAGSQQKDKKHRYRPDHQYRSGHLLSRKMLVYVLMALSGLIFVIFG